MSQVFPDVLMILGDQLFPVEILRQVGVSHVFMAENYDLCTKTRHHQKKLLLFLDAMRCYRDLLKTEGFSVTYVELQPEDRRVYPEVLQAFCEKHQVKNLHHFEIDDKFLQKELSSAQLPQRHTHVSPKFLCSHDFLQSYFSKNKPFMKTFYEKMRHHTGLLMQDKKPVGGQFSYDQDNRKKLPSRVVIPSYRKPQPSKHQDDVMRLIEKEFSEHPGTCRDPWAPTSRTAYLELIQDFIHDKFMSFGDYQDAITNRDTFLFHSLLSPGLNLGLIVPNDILIYMHPYLEKHPEHLSSVEGFVRQLIGWREFMRGLYIYVYPKPFNFWNHNRTLTSHWYEGTTGLPPVDDAIHKSLEFGYCHHIERLMIMGNIFNLIEADPLEVYQWFMNMFVDSADWVMEGNVFGMGLMSDGGVFASKPYISGSNYILKMSDYQKGPWCDIWDGLYWGFVNKHRAFFKSHYRMSMMVRTLDKMSAQRWQTITQASQEFIRDKLSEDSES